MHLPLRPRLSIQANKRNVCLSGWAECFAERLLELGLFCAFAVSVCVCVRAMNIGCDKGVLVSHSETRKTLNRTQSYQRLFVVAFWPTWHPSSIVGTFECWNGS